MIKNYCRSILICCFAATFFLISFLTVQAYNPGQVVGYWLDEGVFCNNNCSPDNPYVVGKDWYGAPGQYRRWGTAGGYSWETEQWVITAPSGCMVNGCTGYSYIYEPVKCISLETSHYEADQHDPVWPYWLIYGYNIQEMCKKCNQEIKETKYQGSNYSSIHRELEDKNECAKFKSGDCKNDPCSGLMCPEYKCEVLDSSKTGRGVGYKCVPKTVSAPTAAKTTLAAADAPVAAGAATAVPKSDAQCCNLTKLDPPWISCPAGDAAHCCPPGFQCKPDGAKKAKNAICCGPADYQEVVDRTGVPPYCNNKKCPPKEDESLPPDKQRSKSCPGSLFTACCKQSQPCGVFEVKKFGIVLGTKGYCKEAEETDCPPGTVDPCAGLCCKSGQTCKESNGISMCIPDSPSGCGTGETYCAGTGDFEEIKKCCEDGTSCVHHPNGYPYCYPSS